MMVATSALPSLESFFGTLTAEITAKTAKLAKLEDPSLEDEDADSNVAAKCVEDAQKTIEEAEDILEQMELEIRSQPEHDRQKALNRWNSYKAELRRQVEQFRRTQKSVAEARKRKQLLGGGGHNNDDVFEVNDTKERLIMNNETVERSGRKLNQGHQLLTETEGIGASVLQELQGQRETLQRSRNRLRDTQDDIGTSSRVLTKMTNRIIQNKIILAGVTILIGLGLLYAVFKLFM